MMGPVSQSATAASKYYYEKDPIYEKNNSRWLGGGCEALGLEVGAAVLKDDFNNIIRGNDLTASKLFRILIPRQGEQNIAPALILFFPIRKAFPSWNILPEMRESRLPDQPLLKTL